MSQNGTEKGFGVRLEGELKDYIEKKRIEERNSYNDTINKAVALYKKIDEFCEPLALHPERFVDLIIEKFRSGELILFKKRGSNGKA